MTIDFPAIWLVEIDALWGYSYWLPSNYSFLYFFQNGRRRTFSIFTITEDKIERIKDCLIPQNETSHQTRFKKLLMYKMFDIYAILSRKIKLFMRNERSGRFRMKLIMWTLDNQK